MENIALSIDNINETTESVDLSNLTVFTEQEAKTLFEKLCNEKYKQIKYLRLPPVKDDKTYPFAEINEFLKHNTSLHELNLHDCNLKYVGFEKIFEGLHANKTLECLNLSNNALGTIAFEDKLSKAVELGHKLAKIIEDNANLKELRLTANQLGNASAAPLLEKLINHQGLEILNLEDNYLNLDPLDDGDIIDIVIKIVKQNKTLVSLELAANSLGASEKISEINECLKNSQIEEFTIESLIPVADSDAICRINSTLNKKNSSAHGNTYSQQETLVGNAGFTKTTPSLFHWIKSHPFYTVFVAVLTLAVILAICVPVIGSIIPVIGTAVGLASTWIASTLSAALSFLAHTTITVSLTAAQISLATVVGALTFTLGIAIGRLTSSIKLLVQEKFFVADTLNIQDRNTNHDLSSTYIADTDKKHHNLKNFFVKCADMLQLVVELFFKLSTSSTGKSELAYTAKENSTASTFGRLANKFQFQKELNSSKCDLSTRDAHLTRKNSFKSLQPSLADAEHIAIEPKAELSTYFKMG